MIWQNFAQPIVDSRPKATKCKGGCNGWVIQNAFTRNWWSLSSTCRGATRVAALAGSVGWVVMVKLLDVSIWAAKSWVAVTVW